jgi:arylformamidase
LVFLDYDQAGLDAQYDNRAKVPEFQSFLDRWSSSSERARANLDCRIAVPFGGGPAATVDVFAGAKEGPAPIHLFIHGGYWTKLSKNEFSFVAHGLVPHGAVVVVMDYALIPTVTMDQLVDQCRACLAWVWKHASGLGGDPERVFVSGHSAGGHLVAMLLATDWRAFDSALPPNPIRGATGISGLYDLEPIQLSYLNEELGLSATSAVANSPAKLARASECPLLLPVGALEGPEYLRQSKSLVGAWATANDSPELQVIPGHHHFSIVTELDDPTSRLSRAVQAQMGPV